MLASVYDKAAGRWRYYQTNQDSFPVRPLGPGSLGIGIEDAIPRLPEKSKPVGLGDVARGVVLSGEATPDGNGVWIGFALVALAAWIILR